jgi:hypothetical protein
MHKDAGTGPTTQDGASTGYVHALTTCLPYAAYMQCLKQDRTTRRLMESTCENLLVILHP